MKERPILFSAPMVRAILADTKTQTRRAVKPQPPAFGENGGPLLRVVETTLPHGNGFDAQHAQDNPRYIGCCPYGQPGDRLWVREAFMHEPADYCWEASVSIPCRPAYTAYRADVDGDSRGAGWKPSIHMPRKLSRINLEITAVRVERLQDISEADAMAEGVTAGDGDFSGCYVCGPAMSGTTAKECYGRLWESINGRESWDANPWVWVIEFKQEIPS